MRGVAGKRAAVRRLPSAAFTRTSETAVAAALCISGTAFEQLHFRAHTRGTTTVHTRSRSRSRALVHAASNTRRAAPRCKTKKSRLARAHALPPLLAARRIASLLSHKFKYFCAKTTAVRTQLPIVVGMQRRQNMAATARLDLGDVKRKRAIISSELAYAPSDSVCSREKRGHCLRATVAIFAATAAIAALRGAARRLVDRKAARDIHENARACARARARSCSV